MKIKCNMILALFLLIIISCKDKGIPTEPINNTPMIDSAWANPSTLKIDEQTILECAAKDDDILQFFWNSSYGSFPLGDTGSAVIWKSPSTAGNYSIQVEVNDGKDRRYALININVVDVPSTPTLVSPPNDARLSIPLTLSWNSNAFTNKYRLQISRNQEFTDVIIDRTNLNYLSENIEGLQNFQKYYWRLGALNEFGSSDWSQTRYFITTTGGLKGIPCPGIPTVTYEGKTYNTVLIGDQCWLKENLDVGTQIGFLLDARNNGVIEKYCYNDDPINCDIYGGLYQWDEAMQYDTTGNIQGICPPGWHIPKAEYDYWSGNLDFNKLINTVNRDGDALREIGEGTGENTSGFSALMAGFRIGSGYVVQNRYFKQLGQRSYFWSSDPNPFHLSIDSYAVVDYLFESGPSTVSPLDKDFGLSVRCIKD